MRRTFGVPLGVSVLIVGLAGCGASSTTVQPPLASGDRIIFTASCPADQPNCNLTQAVAGAIAILRQRLGQGLGLAQYSVNAQGATVTVEIPLSAASIQTTFMIQTTGAVRFIDTQGNPLTVGAAVDPTQFPVLFTNADLDTSAISVTTDPDGQPAVIFAMQGTARTAFATYTQQNIGTYLTITLDNVVIESAVIQSAIDTSAEISGHLTTTQANDLAIEMKYGALPLVLTLVSEGPFGVAG